MCLLQIDIPIHLASQIVDLTREYLEGRNNPSHSVFVRESELLQDAQEFILQELIPFWASFLHKNGYDTRAASRSSKPSGVCVCVCVCCVCACMCMCVYVCCECACMCMCVVIYIVSLNLNSVPVRSYQLIQ